LIKSSTNNISGATFTRRSTKDTSERAGIYMLVRELYLLGGIGDGSF